MLGITFPVMSLQKNLGGAIVAVEHRFYGKSQPTGSLTNLELLTSHQALFDLKQFQQWFVQPQNYNMTGSPVFCMGGSYPGNLAAWYRQLFPALTNGCWSASGPVEALEDWPGFGEKVWQSVSTNKWGVRDVGDTVATKLYAGYEQLAGIIQDPTPGAHATLMDIFNVCPGTLASQGDRDCFEMTVNDAVGEVMQYNNTKTPKLDAIREIVVGADTAFDAAIGVSKFLNLTGSAQRCSDYSLGSFYSSLELAELPSNGEGNAMRTWTWQTCNEFGYFQTATSKFNQSNLYTRGASARSLWQQVCEQIFQVENSKIGANIAETNAVYGGKNPSKFTNLFISHGELDAWSLLGMTDVPANNNEVYGDVAEMGSHCVGMYSYMDGEVPGATRIRNKAYELFKKWGAAGVHNILV